MEMGEEGDYIPIVIPSVHRPQLLKSEKESRSRFEPRSLCLTARPNRLIQQASEATRHYTSLTNQSTGSTAKRLSKVLCQPMLCLSYLKLTWQESKEDIKRSARTVRYKRSNDTACQTSQTDQEEKSDNSTPSKFWQVLRWVQAQVLQLL